MASSPSSRKQCDFTKLLLAGYEVELKNGSTVDFYVSFRGPKDTIYARAYYRIHVELPDQYPFCSPSIGFEPYSIFHPNIDERSGSVCLDVINQTLTPLYSLLNVFEVFLPQLLTYPNPSDPLNGDAANLYLKDKAKYEEKVKSYVETSIKVHKARQLLKESEENGNGQNDGGGGPTVGVPDRVDGPSAAVNANNNVGGGRAANNNGGTNGNNSRLNGGNNNAPQNGGETVTNGINGNSIFDDGFYHENTSMTSYSTFATSISRPMSDVGESDDERASGYSSRPDSPFYNNNNFREMKNIGDDMDGKSEMGAADFELRQEGSDDELDLEFD